MLYWHSIMSKGRDAIFVMLPSNFTKERVMPMNTIEVLTLLLVVFAALTYLDQHNKKQHPTDQSEDAILNIILHEGNGNQFRIPFDMIIQWTACICKWSFLYYSGRSDISNIKIFNIYLGFAIPFTRLSQCGFCVILSFL